MYIIAKTENGIKTYLSTNKINLNSFDSIEYAWFTNDLELAIRMLIKIKRNIDTKVVKVTIEPYKRDD